MDPLTILWRYPRLIRAIVHANNLSTEKAIQAIMNRDEQVLKKAILFRHYIGRI